MEIYHRWKVQSTRINVVGKTRRQAEALIRTHAVRLGIDPDDLWELLLLASIAYVKTLRIAGDNALLVVYRNQADNITNIVKRDTVEIVAGNFVRAVLKIYTPNNPQVISQVAVHYGNYFLTGEIAEAQMEKIIAEAEQEK